MFREEGQGRFHKFTERARKVLALAQEEALRMGHNYVGSEHILLGLLRESDGVAGRVLQSLGMELARTREAIEHMRSRSMPEVGLTSDAKQVIEVAMGESHQLIHRYIGTEHLLLGLVSLPESVAVQVLRAMGFEEQTIRTQTLQSLRNYTSVSDRVNENGREGKPALRSEEKHHEKFNEEARKVLQFAHEEAQRFQHNYIGTEHLLLGLVRMDESMAGQVLRRLGIELYKVRNAVEFIVGRGERIVIGEIGLTPRAKKVIELAVDEAQKLKHSFVGSEHLLLGLVREGEGIAAGVLESLGARLERVRTAVRGGLSVEENALQLAYAYARGEKPLDSPVSGVQDADDLVPEPTSEEERGNLFTIRARRVLLRSREEARQYQQGFVGSEHLLLALVRETNGLAYHVLHRQGVSIDRILSATHYLIVEEKLRESAEIEGLTTDGKQALALAIEEARELTPTAIGVEHLLLGLLRCEGIASGVLITRGLTLDNVRAEIRWLMGLKS